MSPLSLSATGRRALAAALIAAAALAVGAPRAADAQVPSAAPPAAPAPEVGQTAPDFEVAGATRYGLLRSPVRLSDYRGQTVVLSFFPAARTKG